MTGTDRGAASEHVKGGQEDQRHACGLVEAESLGNRDDVCRRYGDQFTVASGDPISEDGKFRAQILAARDTLLAVIAEVHRGEQNALGGEESGDVFSDFHDLAGDVAAGDVWQLDPREPLADPQVEMVQGASLDANEDLVLARFRIWNFFVVQNFGTTKFVNDGGFH
jgi:hypothetical protein